MYMYLHSIVMNASEERGEWRVVGNRSSVSSGVTGDQSKIEIITTQ